MVVVGVLYVDIVGYFGSWRWLSVACIALCLIWVLALIFVPETPSYLMSKKDFDGARRALTVSLMSSCLPVSRLSVELSDLIRENYMYNGVFWKSITD
jgi:hypothetical protein